MVIHFFNSSHEFDELNIQDFQALNQTFFIIL